MILRYQALFLFYISAIFAMWLDVLTEFRPFHAGILTLVSGILLALSWVFASRPSYRPLVMTSAALSGVCTGLLVGQISHLVVQILLTFVMAYMAYQIWQHQISESPQEE